MVQIILEHELNLNNLTDKIFKGKKKLIYKMIKNIVSLKYREYFIENIIKNKKYRQYKYINNIFEINIAE